MSVDADVDVQAPYSDAATLAPKAALGYSTLFRCTAPSNAASFPIVSMMLAMGWKNVATLFSLGSVGQGNNDYINSLVLSSPSVLILSCFVLTAYCLTADFGVWTDASSASKLCGWSSGGGLDQSSRSVSKSED